MLLDLCLIAQYPLADRMCFIWTISLARCEVHSFTPVHYLIAICLRGDALANSVKPLQHYCRMTIRGGIRDGTFGRYVLIITYVRRHPLCSTRNIVICFLSRVSLRLTRFLRARVACSQQPAKPWPPGLSQLVHLLCTRDGKDRVIVSHSGINVP